MKQKYYVEVNRQEWRLIIEALNRLRNKLIAAGRYTDAVDEMLIKVAILPGAIDDEQKQKCAGSNSRRGRIPADHKAVLRTLQGNDGGLRRHQQDRQAISLLYVQKRPQEKVRQEDRQQVLYRGPCGQRVFENADRGENPLHCQEGG